MKIPLVSIIIINWNGIRWLSECFKSLYAQDWKNIEIIFVDNASTDDSVSWVKKHYPKTRICVNSTNLGFADANNVGFRVVKGEYVLFLNNDTRVTKTFLTELIRVFERDSSIGGAQSKILLMDHPDRYDSVGSYLTYTGFLYHFGFGKKDSKKFDMEIELYTAKGACMMFPRAVLENVCVEGNIFDPEYFAYFEESDLCHRVWLAGYRIVYAYRSVIYHKMGATSSLMNNGFIQYHSFKNRIRTYLKNLSTTDGWRIIPLHILIVELYGLYALAKGRGDLWLATQKAIGWNISHFGRTMKLRNIIQQSINTHTVDLHRRIFRHPPIRYYQALLTDLSKYDE